MKRNVDLTAGRIFSQDIRVIPDLLLHGLFNFHPWDYEHIRVVHSDADLISNRSGFVLCGNATQRQAQRFNKSLDSGEICECCGTDLTKKPWAKRYCLCQQCNERLKKDLEKSWRFKDDSILESHDRVVIEMNRRS